MSDILQRLDVFGRALWGWLGPINLWTAALLVGALLLDRALAKHARASLRIALYAPIGLRVILPLSWTIPVVHAPRVVSFLTPLPDVAAPPPALAPAAHAFTWQAVLAVAYFAVAAVVTARAVIARVRLRRALAAASPVDVAGAPCAVVAHEDLGPMAVGLFSPRVVLPRKLLEQGNEHALGCVLRHEAAHLGRHDAWLSLFLQIAAVAAWPVLPIWIAAARVRHLVELACDEAALQGADAGERRRYGHALLDMVELAVAPLGAGELHFGATLRARIEALAAQRHWPRAAQAACVLAVIAGFAACSSVGPSAPTEVTTTQKPEDPTIPESELRQPIRAGGQAVVVNGVALRTNADLMAHCPHFVRRAMQTQGNDFIAFWLNGAVDSFPAEEVAFCRDPALREVLIQNAWSAEGRNAIGQIAKDMASAYEREGTRTGHFPAALCPSGSPEPAVAQARGAKYQPTSDDWQSAGWACLRFAMDSPFFFQYAFTTDATSFVITAHAQFPDNGHGVDVTMKLRGNIGADGELNVAPSIEETWTQVP
jgi:beta-lactamase regulating signal transducer with metallopeptidase domain